MLAPLLDDDDSLLQAIEDFAVEAFIAQLAIKGFAVAVLPGAAGLDVERLRAELREPAAHDLCRHFCAVVGPNVLWHAPGEHHVGHRLDDTQAVDATGYPDRQAFPGEFVDQGHQPKFAPIVGLRLDEVVAPDMVAMLRPQTDARSVVEPEPAARPMLPGYFQPLMTPDPLDPITSDPPAGLDQQRCDPAIAVSSVLGRERDNRSRQRTLISPDDRGVSLCSAGLANDPAGLAFRETILLPNALYSLPAPLGAYKFPEATSLRTCFSSDKSATRRLSRTFSRSRPFIRFA
jgi:hypothetical protein